MLNIAHCFTFVETRRMALSEWLGIPDCPFQRNTEAHAKKATHLKTFDDSHRRVTMAVLPNNTRIKVDGHTRSLLWSRHAVPNLPSPLWLEVDVYKCPDAGYSSLGVLYRRFDSRMAVETPADETFSAVREMNIKFKSPMMNAAHFGGILKRLYIITNGYAGTKLDDTLTYKVVNYFADELRQFDDTGPLQKAYVGHIMMTALLTFMRYGSEAREFWVKYNDNDGRKAENGVDGVQAMHNLLTDIRWKKHTGQPFDLENIGRALNAFHAFRKGKCYSNKSGLPLAKEKTELETFIARAVTHKKGAR